jgi:hypothetical protein
MPARALTGDQVTDDRWLVVAKLADRRIDVPAFAYRDLRDVYAAATTDPERLVRLAERCGLSSSITRAVEALSGR